MFDIKEFFFSVRGLAISLFLLVFVSDQLTKFWALSSLAVYLPYRLTSFLNFTLAFNTGAAFSLLSGPQFWRAWFFIAFAVFASIYILMWLFRLEPHERVLSCALSLILGGAVSNLYDRLSIGHVVDFIDVHYQGYHWPIFNLADTAICIGAMILFFGLNHNKESACRKDI